MNPICLFDGHCDTVYRGSLPAEDPHRSRGDLASNSGHLDLNRLQRAYGGSCQFFALFGYPADFPGKAAEEIFRLEYGWFARQMELHSGRAAHCRTGEEARQALHRMAKENFAILYLTEQLSAQLQPEIARYQDALTPAIILIPGKEGSLGIGMANIKTAVERAVGADIL